MWKLSMHGDVGRYPVHRHWITFLLMEFSYSIKTLGWFSSLEAILDVFVERLTFLEFQSYSATGIDGKLHRRNCPVLYGQALVDKCLMSSKEYQSLVLIITGMEYS